MAVLTGLTAQSIGAIQSRRCSVKKLIVLLLVAGGGLYFWKGKEMLEPAPAKAYRAHVASELRAKGFSNETSSSTRWSLEVSRCSVENGVAEVYAQVVTKRIPPNAASFAFATIVQTERKARLENQGGIWKVVDQQILKEEVSTFDDRKAERAGVK
jgi:hypothetical protein